MNGNKVINDEFERTALMADYHDRRPVIVAVAIVLVLVLLAVLLVASSRPAGAQPPNLVRYLGMVQAPDLDQTTYSYEVSGVAKTWSLSACANVTEVIGCRNWTQSGGVLTCEDGINALMTLQTISVTTAGLGREGHAQFWMDDEVFGTTGSYCEPPTAVSLASFETVAAAGCYCVAEHGTSTIHCSGGAKPSLRLRWNCRGRK